MVMTPTFTPQEPPVETQNGRAPEHICEWCPNCGAQLEGSRCKLVCRHCAYYMSCADYY
jgi:hypothetical protein